MELRNRYGPRVLWYWAWRNLVQSALLSASVYVGYEWLGWKSLSIPFLPVSTIGTAAAFYLGFKNNSSYDRLWEARQIWGAITNVSRAWAALILSVANDSEDEVSGPSRREGRSDVERLVYRQVAWTNALRIQLRQRPAPHREKGNAALEVAWLRKVGITEAFDVDGEMEAMLRRLSCRESADEPLPANVANDLLRRQAEDIAQLKRLGRIDGFEHAELTRLVTECYAQQGAAERIKSYPLPRQYSNFSYMYVKIFIFLVPFGLIKEMAELGKGASWLVVPLSLLIAWVFYSMEQIGASSEDPFEGAVHDVPLSAICRNIEIDLRAMLGETELPSRLEPVNGVLL